MRYKGAFSLNILNGRKDGVWGSIINFLKLTKQSSYQERSPLAPFPSELTADLGDGAIAVDPAPASIPCMVSHTLTAAAHTFSESAFEGQ